MGPFTHGHDSSFTVLDWQHDTLQYVMDDGLMASLGGMFDRARFGRDTAYMIQAAMSLPGYEWIVDRGIRSFASTFAQEPQVASWRTDALHVGQTMHENRRLFINGKRVNRRSTGIIRQLAEDWGGDPEKGFTTYFSTDATPLAVISIVQRCLQIGTTWHEYLNQIVEHELNGGENRLIDVLIMKTEWVAYMVTTDHNSLLSSRRRTPFGHYFSWRHDENKGAYVHPRLGGLLANGNGRLASSEGQSLAYDALVMASDLLEADFPHLTSRWRAMAGQLQRKTMDLLWSEKLGSHGFIAQGLDQDPITGGYRRIDNVASNTCEMLNSRIFDDLPEEERRQYLTGLYKTMWYELQTPVGLRSMWKYAQKFLPCFFYWGPTSKWAIDDHIAQRGQLRSRHAAPGLAIQHMYRSLNGLNVARSPLENIFVTIDDGVVYDPRQTREVNKERIPFLATDQPNGQQGWTSYSVAYMDVMLPILLQGPQEPEEDWLRDVQRQILQDIPPVRLYETQAELDEVFEQGVHVYVDTQRAKRIQASWASFVGQNPTDLKPDALL